MKTRSELLKRAMELLAQWNNSQGLQDEDREFFIECEDMGFPAPDWFHETLHTPKEQDVLEFWAAWEFALYGTGGGCTALSRELKERGTQILITEAHDAHHPRTVRCPVAVGLYDIESGVCLAELDVRLEPREFSDSEAALLYVIDVLEGTLKLHR